MPLPIAQGCVVAAAGEHQGFDTVDIHCRQVHAGESFDVIRVGLTQLDCRVCQLINGLRNSDVGLFEKILSVDNSASARVQRKCVQLVIPASCINEGLNELVTTDLVVEVIDGCECANRCKDSGLGVTGFDQIGAF